MKSIIQKFGIIKSLYQNAIHSFEMSIQSEVSNDTDIDDHTTDVMIKCLYEKDEYEDTCIIINFDEKTRKNSIDISSFRGEQYHTCCLFAGILDKIEMFDIIFPATTIRSMKSLLCTYQDIYEIYHCIYNHYKISLLNYDPERTININSIDTHFRLNTKETVYYAFNHFISNNIFFDNLSHSNNENKSVTDSFENFIKTNDKNISFNENVIKLIKNNMKQNEIFFNSNNSDLKISAIIELSEKLEFNSIYITEKFAYDIFSNHDEHNKFLNMFQKYAIGYITIEITKENILFSKKVLLANRDSIKHINLIFKQSKHKKYEILQICQLLNLQKNRFRSLKRVYLSGLGHNETYDIYNVFSVTNASVNKFILKITKTKGEIQIKKRWERFRQIFIDIYIETIDINLCKFLHDENNIYFSYGVFLTIKEEEITEEQLNTIVSIELHYAKYFKNIGIFRICVKSSNFKINEYEDNIKESIYQKFYCILLRLMQNACVLIIYNTRVNFLKYIKNENLNLEVDHLKIISSTVEILNICKSIKRGALGHLKLEGFSTLYSKSVIIDDANKLKIGEITVNYLNCKTLEFLRNNVLIVKYNVITEKLNDSRQYHYKIVDYSFFIEEHVVKALECNNNFTRSKDYCISTYENSSTLMKRYERYYRRLLYPLSN